MDKPRIGDTLRCETCGMELQVLQSCQCEEGEPKFECCGEPLRQQSATGAGRS